MKVRHWNTLQREIAELKEKYPAPPANRFNKHPDRVPVSLPSYKTPPVQNLPGCTSLLGTATSCKKDDKLASRWQRKPVAEREERV